MYTRLFPIASRCYCSWLRCRGKAANAIALKRSRALGLSCSNRQFNVEDAAKASTLLTSKGNS